MTASDKYYLMTSSSNYSRDWSGLIELLDDFGLEALSCILLLHIRRNSPWPDCVSSLIIIFKSCSMNVILS